MPFPDYVTKQRSSHLHQQRVIISQLCKQVTYLVSSVRMASPLSDGSVANTCGREIYGVALRHLLLKNETQSK